MPNCLGAPLPMCPITHVNHPPRYLISIFSINHNTPLPMCPIAHVSKKMSSMSKKMSSCQKDVKCQNSQTHGLWRRFTKKNSHNEVHTYWCQFSCHIWWWPKSLKMCIESVFEEFWWPSYLMSKLTSICVNLIMWIYFFLWTSSIVCVFDFLTFDIFLTFWHLFDILTSFWHFDIFLTFWHLFDILTFWHLF